VPKINRDVEKYKSISEVSGIIGVPAYVLRFWETEFKEIKPYRDGNRRYYLPRDIKVLMRVKSLVHEQGFTLEGARQQLRAKDVVTTSSMCDHKVIEKAIRKLREIQASISIEPTP
jgi:DNA-binding transcriptional MerR regulator